MKKVNRILENECTRVQFAVKVLVKHEQTKRKLDAIKFESKKKFSYANHFNTN